jgi:hypothetical protein
MMKLDYLIFGFAICRGIGFSSNGQEKVSSSEEPSKDEVQRLRITEQINMYLNKTNTQFTEHLWRMVYKLAG